MQHFLSSLLAGTLEQGHYEVSMGTLSFLRSGSPKSLEPGDITLFETGLWDMKRVMFNDWLMIDHYGKKGKETNYLALDQGSPWWTASVI